MWYSVIPRILLPVLLFPVTFGLHFILSEKHKTPAVKMLQPLLPLLNSKRIILASSSPRRKELLERIVGLFPILFSFLFVLFSCLLPSINI